jgi:acyl-CoA hydrolase
MPVCMYTLIFLWKKWTVTNVVKAISGEFVFVAIDENKKPMRIEIENIKQD